jgi:hypothetical protein
MFSLELVYLISKDEPDISGVWIINPLHLSFTNNSAQLVSEKSDFGLVCLQNLE